MRPRKQHKTTAASTPAHACLPWRNSGFALLAGCLHATSFAPGPLPASALAFVQLACMAVLSALVWRSTGARHAAWLGMVFGLGNFGTGLYWLHISIHEHGGVAWLPAALAVLLLAAFAALYITGASALAWIWRPQGGYFPANSLRAAVAWANSWTLAEWLRGSLLSGFPWLNIAYAHTDSVFSGWVSVTGAYGVAWFAAFTAATLALMLLLLLRVYANSGRQIAATVLTFCFLIFLLFPALLLTGAGAAGGALLANHPWTSPTGPALTVRLVQGAVAQSEKFNPMQMRQTLERYRALTALPPTNGGMPPDLIVLPETVIPVTQDRLPAEEWQHWRAIARAQQATLLLGVPVHTTSHGRSVYTNSVVALDGDTNITALRDGAIPRYDKTHLVPFGEFVPAGFRWFVDAMNIPLGEFERGPARQRLFAVAGQTLALNICYEDVFGEEIAPAVHPNASLGDAGASVLVNVSNLAWFGDSWALRQHLQMARMRSMETGRPMLRATNTGMTAAISPQGVVYAALPAQRIGVLDVSVQGMQGLTPYVRTGNVPVLAWIALTLLALWLWQVRSRRAASATASTIPRSAP